MTKKEKILHAFLVTRSQIRATSENLEGESDDQETEAEDREEEQEGGPKSDDSNGEEEGGERMVIRAQKYHRLKFTHIKELKSAVSLYGPTAPFTISLLESLSEDWLTVNDWAMLTEATLTRGDFLLWKADYGERCQDIARRNTSVGGHSKSWTIEKLMGNKPFDTNEKQAKFPSGLLVQIQHAALKAWKSLPSQGSAVTSLAKVRQGPHESYSEFIGCLTEAAERLMGKEETDSELIKHLAFENANSASQAALHPHRHSHCCDKAITDFIRLCSDVDPALRKIGLAIGAALKDFTQSQKPKTCFNCKQPGHFSKVCTALKTEKPPPPSLCPRCKRGKHWASECRSKTDIQGNPLPPKRGKKKPNRTEPWGCQGSSPK
ncbi:endogenous retrovirus group K member 6 Gag polyprotein-like isoform X2 [Dipodomys spectabilis]|nr:endogenous retrovirus group K member 6 Gag polyprotein-like isoform X2 [Dipodomys spectabilis]